MRYLMRQKLFSWGDDFQIKDYTGRDIFSVKAEILAVGHKLSFQDIQGQELAFIQQRLLTWGNTYEIYCNKSLYATVSESIFSLFQREFTVDLPGPNDLKVEGNLDYDYVFSRKGAVVAQVSQKWFALTDTYGVDIANGEDDILILASTVVIDVASHQDNTVAINLSL